MTPRAAPYAWVATCARGLEEIVAGELRALDLDPGARDPGGVAFRGDFAAGLRANWRLRAANRILLHLAAWAAPTDDLLYRGARRLVADSRWSDLLHPARTLAVAATSSRSAIRDTRWIALKVKDGIVDGQRERHGRRSDVARSRPDLGLRLRLHDDRAALLLDTSGEPLDRRGYRLETTSAPVREQIAAAALLGCGWSGVGPVVDFMCGSGTFLAEAGAIALGLAPNRLRTRWGFESLPFYEAGLWARVVGEPMAAPDPAVRLFGVDREAQAVAAARRNLEAAGLLVRARIELGEADALVPPAPPGLVAVNPPYGERLGADAAAWRSLGDLLKRRYAGWRAVVLAGGEGLGKELGLRPARRIPFRNGPLDARILALELW